MVGATEKALPAGFRHPGVAGLSGTWACKYEKAQPVNGSVVTIVRYINASSLYLVLSPAGSISQSFKFIHERNLRPLDRGSSSEYSSSNNVTPGHFIEAILDGSIVGPCLSTARGSVDRCGFAIRLTLKPSGSASGSGR